MSVGDFCRFCNENLRVNGVLSNASVIFERSKSPFEKSLWERLSDVGCSVSIDNKAKSPRMCWPCVRLLQRMEADVMTLRRWREIEHGAEEAVEEAGTSIKREREEFLVSEAPNHVKKQCPDPPATTLLPGPFTEMPPRYSMTEVVVRFPSEKVEKIKPSADTAGIIENIARGKWKTATNLLVRHKELFSQLKEHLLQLVEDEAKLLCNPYKGFMLWRSSAEELKDFSFEGLAENLKQMSPFIFSIFSQITRESLNPMCVAAAIALRGREPRLSAFAYYVNNILLCGGGKKAVFTRLSHLGITTTLSNANAKQKEPEHQSAEIFPLNDI